MGEAFDELCRQRQMIQIRSLLSRYESTSMYFHTYVCRITLRFYFHSENISAEKSGSGSTAPDAGGAEEGWPGEYPGLLAFPANSLPGALPIGTILFYAI